MREVKFTSVSWGPSGSADSAVIEDGKAVASFNNRGRRGDGELRRLWVTNGVTLAQLKEWAQGQLTLTEN
jgi:hypothetical protein